MKILYLTDQLYLHGGIEKVLSQKVNYLADILAHNLTVLTYRQDHKTPVYALSDKIKFLDISVNYDISKSYFHPENIRKVPAHRSALRKVFKDLRPDVIVSSSFGPDFFFLPFISGDIPVIKEFHSSRAINQAPYTVKNRILNALSAYVEKKYTQLVVLNQDEVQYYPTGSVSVIPNPAQMSSEIIPLGQKKILAAGRISPVKNFGDLIQAFARVSKDFPEWELHIWGEDYIDTKKQLQKTVDRFSLNAEIKFMGLTDDLQKIMQNYSIYAMTSQSECFPMVLLEALSAGLPIVTYDSPTGPRHIVKNGQDGFLVPYKNLDIFTDRLKFLMKNEELRNDLGAKGRINAQRYSIEKVMQQWEHLFTTVRNQTPPYPLPQLKN